MLVRVLRRCIPLSSVVLAVIDAVILVGAMYLGVAIHYGATALGPDTSILPLFPKALVFAGLMLAALTAFGLYRRRNQDENAGQSSRSALAFLAGIGLAALIFRVVPGLALGQGALALTAVMAFVGHITVRDLFLTVASRRGLNKRQILLAESSRRAADVVQRKRGSRGGEKIPVVDFPRRTGATKGVDALRIVRSNGRSRPDVAARRLIDTAARMPDRRYGQTPMRGLLERRLNGANLIDVPTFVERQTGRIRLESVNPDWLIVPVSCHHRAFSKTGKRLFDLGVGSLLLLLTLPVILVTMLAIWLESGRPMLRRQARIGAHGRLFYLLTFRSARSDAEDDARTPWAAKNRARVTRVGRIIRELRLDELPKLFNVVKGDMSFVGPQPERPTFVQSLSTKIGYYPFRHAVRPGITGWAQVRRRYGASLQNAKEKLEYDLYYVKNYNLFLDLVILGRTAQIALMGRRAD